MKTPIKNLDADAIKACFDALLSYCRREGWKGYDPYDGLNARLLKWLPLPGKLARMAWIQACKRSPVNFRPLVGVPKCANPKGHALAVRALLRRAASAQDNGESEKDFEHQARVLLQELDAMRSEQATGDAWGYPFDWQSRAFFVPCGSPSIVCTTFVAQAYLDAYERRPEPPFLETARRACDFILNDLARTPDLHDPTAFCFSYTPLDRTQVHNASLLGAALLARVFSYTKEPPLREAALAAARYTVHRQRIDGSWPYGEAPNQQWIDSFHTGFNLVCLDEIMRYGECREFEAHLARGFEFFCSHFFLSDGRPKYYAAQPYPIDIHSAAQALVTLTTLQHLNSSGHRHLEACARWTLENMRSSEGYFYFQQTPLYINRIPYLRWSQTWMLYGLSLLLKEFSK